MADLLKTVAAIVSHTPVWVWVLYALLLFLGFQRTRDSTVPVWRMLILPLVVAGLASASIIGAQLETAPALLLGLGIGAAAGWRLERDANTRRLPDGRIWLRGEWASFALLVMVLAFRYATSVAAAMDPALRTALAWQLSTVFVSTALSALFLGRTAARLKTIYASDALAA